MTKDWDAVVVGGGVAGLSAALMLGRSRRRTLVIDAGDPRNAVAAHMHGMLGHDGVDPLALLQRGRDEVAAYGVQVEVGVVLELRNEDDRVRIVSSGGKEDTARVVVLASGVRDELPEVPGLREEWGRRVLGCPYCHGWEVAGQRLAVLATGPQSLHQAELVRQLTDDLVVFSAAAEPLEEAASGRLIARGVRVVPAAVSEIGAGAALTIATVDGDLHEVDAIFTGGVPTIDLGFLGGLTVDRTDAPGSPVRADLLGATSHPRLFAAGNAVQPFGNVPVSMSSGSMAGAGANAALVAEDGTIAVARRTAERNAGWEDRYAESGRFWSGRVNATVADLIEGRRPGSALDVGSGEGGDVVWLAEHGWQTTGVDVSPTAVARARTLAADHGVQIDLRVGDGAASIDERFDLVLASFLHSEQPDFPRITMLRDAADRVAPDGTLLIVSHASIPPWADHDHSHDHMLRSPQEELALLALDPETWQVEIAETRLRDTTAPDGTPAELHDGVLLLHRTR